MTISTLSESPHESNFNLGIVWGFRLDINFEVQYKSTKLDIFINFIRLASFSWKARNKQIQFAFHYPWKVFRGIFSYLVFILCETFHWVTPHNEKLFQKDPKTWIEMSWMEIIKNSKIIHKLERDKVPTESN